MKILISYQKSYHSLIFPFQPIPDAKRCSRRHEDSIFLRHCPVEHCTRGRSPCIPSVLYHRRLQYSSSTVLDRSIVTRPTSGAGVASSLVLGRQSSTFFHHRLTRQLGLRLVHHHSKRSLSLRSLSCLKVKGDDEGPSPRLGVISKSTDHPQSRDRLHIQGPFPKGPSHTHQSIAYLSVPSLHWQASRSLIGSELLGWPVPI